MPNSAKPARWLSLLVAIAIGLGVAFRVSAIHQKLYWHDEAYTSLRLSGYTQAEVLEQVFTGAVVAAPALERYQQVNPDRGVAATVRTLAIDDAQHPPFYYGLLRLWAGLWGSSATATRSFSVLAGLLTLPLMYGLSQELFADRWVSAMAAALVAVSPFHVLYAQEAREYALWTALVVLSSWLLLRSLRLNTVRSWALYALSLVLGFYTYLFTGLVAIGHGAYVLGVERRLSRAVVGYVAGSAIAVALFLPWLWLVITSWSQTGATWTSTPIPLVVWLKLWGLSLDRAFVLTPGDFGFDTLLVYLTLPLVLVLVLMALVVLCRQTPLRVWGFVLTLIGSTALPLVLPDLLIGGQRSTSSRYLIPCYLGIQLAVAYLLAARTRLSCRSRRLWQGVAVVVLLAGVVSNAIALPAETAWNKVVSHNNLAVVRLINQADRPLLITSSFGINFGNLLALSHSLDRDVQLQLVRTTGSPDSGAVPTIADDYDAVFLLNPSDRLRQAIEQQQNQAAALVFQDFHLSLWRLSN